MAKGWRRLISFELDKSSAKKAGAEMEQTLARAGARGGDSFHRELREAFNKIIADLKVKLAAGVIDEKEFKKQSDEAAKAFNRSMLRSMDEARKKGNLTDREYVKLSKTLKRVGTDGDKSAGLLTSGFGKVALLFGGVFALNRVKDFGIGLIRTAIEAEAPWNRLRGTLSNVNIALADVSAEIKANARAMQDATAVGDEDYAAILQDLISISGNYQGSLNNVQVVADLAAEKQIELKTAAELVGKAMVGETGTLKRYGIVVQEGADAVEVMRERFRGAAENEVKALAGQLKQVGNEAGDASEAAGNLILRLAGGEKYLNNFRLGLKGIAEWLDRIAETADSKVARAIDGAGGSIEQRLKRARDLLAQLQADRISKANERVPTGGLGVGSVARNQAVRGFDEQIAAAQRAIDTLQAQIEAGPPPPGVETEAQREAREKAAEAQSRAAADRESALNSEIRLLSRGHELGILNADQAERGTDLHEQTRIALKKQNITLEERLKLIDRLNTLDPFAQIKVETGVLTERTSMQHGGAEDTRGVPTFDVGDVTTQPEKLKDAWGDAFDYLIERAEETESVVSGAFNAIADGGLKGLARFAGMKSKEALALALGSAARGIAALASPLSSFAKGESAETHFEAAAKFGVEAGAWKALGAAGASSGAANRAVSAGGYRNVGGPAADRAQPPQVVNHIYIDPLNPYDPAYQRNHAATAQNARENHGAMSVRVHPRTGR